MLIQDLKLRMLYKMPGLNLFINDTAENFQNHRLTRETKISTNYRSKLPTFEINNILGRQDKISFLLNFKQGKLLQFYRINYI